ncbi:hypothetical protein QYE76_057117 [Lolium multiflorum]|uniref:Uncharacterized protein n=1 Tax=Lolium multiflorum TaxID=4521 RepID=A0AAD8T4M8_LOLMU|nr:hypothetical protein QYE76_057117 [Lolium multiflorum]
MAEIFGSAVASESVSRIFSIISGNPSEHGSREDNAERTEFAVLKIHSVVAVSEDWQILHQPLLSWKARLKCAAKEGDGILRAYRRRSTERQRVEGTAITLQIISTARKRIARAAKRFVPFGLGRGEDDDADKISDATVRRFERLAGVAGEFFRYVQFGGRPRSLIMPSSFKVPTELLLAGKTLEYSIRNGSMEALLLLHPFDVGRRKEIFLFLSYGDTSSWQKNFILSVRFRLLTSDILNIVMSSLELLPPQFGAACVTTREFAREFLAQETRYSINPSSMSTWCIHMSQRFYYDSIEKPSAATGDKPQLPLPIIRVDARCFTLPPNGPSHTPAEDDLPLRLVCHVDPHLVPKSYSEHYDQIDLETLQELLPKVTNEGAHVRKGNWWCPLTSTYLIVEPQFSVPLPTLQQMYLLQNSERAV